MTTKLIDPKKKPKNTASNQTLRDNIYSGQVSQLDPKFSISVGKNLDPKFSISDGQDVNLDPKFSIQNIKPPVYNNIRDAINPNKSTQSTSIVQNNQPNIRNSIQQTAQQNGVQGNTGQQNKYNITAMTSNSDYITQEYDNIKNNLVSQLKQRIAEQKNQQQQMIQNAPQQFQPLRNQSELQRVQGLETLKETIANRGDRGGIGRQELLTSNISGENRLNNIELEQQKVISDANNAIRQLEANGQFEEAQIISQAAGDRLRAIIEDNNRVQAGNVDLAKFNIQTGLQEKQMENQESQFNQQFTEGQRQFNQGQDNWQQQFSQAATQLDLDNIFRQAQADIQNKYNQGVFDADQAQREIDNLNTAKQFAEQQRQFEVGQSNYKEQFEFTKSQTEIDNVFRQAQADIQEKYNQGIFDQQKAQTALDNLFREKQYIESQRQFNAGMDLNRDQFNFQKSQSGKSGKSGKTMEQQMAEWRETAIRLSDGDATAAEDIYNYLSGQSNKQSTSPFIGAGAFGASAGFNPQIKGATPNQNNNITLDNVPGDNKLSSMFKKGWFK